MLAILLAYQYLSLVHATTGFLEKPAHAATPVVLGLCSVVYALFLFFYLLMRFHEPRWRDQWTYYESLGYPYETWMQLMHAPLWFCPLADALFVKDAGTLARLAPSGVAVLLCTVTYVCFYAAVSSINHAKTQCYVYPWMYDIDALGLGALGHAVYYATLAIPVALVLLGCRAAIVRRGAGARAKEA